MIKSPTALRIPVILALALLMLGTLSLGSAQVSAAPQSAPISQCNNDTASNVGGQGLACTISIVNNVNDTGSATAPTSITVTKCTGAAGPVGAGAGNCATTTSSSATPINSVMQCDGSSNGGGGVLICTVTLTNNISGTTTLTPATTYQCIGSVITGPGAPGSCTPVNTPGITSVTAATVGQCNNSGNGGTSVSFACSVTTGSTMTSAFSVNVDQCNGSANGGGSLVRCTATVTNVLTQAPPAPRPDAGTPIPTPTAIATATPVPTIAPTATPAPTLAPVAIIAPTATPTPRPAVIVPGLPSTSTQAIDTSVPLGLLALLVAALGGLLVRSRRTIPTTR